MTASITKIKLNEMKRRTIKVTVRMQACRPVAYGKLAFFISIRPYSGNPQYFLAMQAVFS